MSPTRRSQVPITTDDLARLAQIARLDREQFFTRHPKYSALANRVIAVALCQGAALHYPNGRNGIKDFDVWSFYSTHPAHPETKYPSRRYVARDYGHPKFGQSPDHPEFVGRKVDLFGRSLEADVNTDPVAALRVYLSERRTTSARDLAQKAVVLIAPESFLGTVVWPVHGQSAQPLRS